MQIRLKKVLLLLVSLSIGCGVLLDRPHSTVEAASVTSFSAHADVNGAPVTTDNPCGPSAITDVRVVTPSTPQVGQTFHMILTVAALARSGAQCVPRQNQLISINYQLPQGVESDPQPEQSRCIVFPASNLASSTVRSCQRFIGDGFERVNPLGQNEWTLNPNGVNVVQIQLGVRARTTGLKRFTGKVCDASSSIQCVGNGPNGDIPPFANAIPFVEFNVNSAPVMLPERLMIERSRWVCPPNNPGCLDQNLTTTKIKVLAWMNGSRPSGTWIIQRKGPNKSDEFLTIATKEVSADTGIISQPATAENLQPATTYRFRACFTPTFGTQTCGSSMQLTTLSQWGAWMSISNLCENCDNLEPVEAFHQEILQSGAVVEIKSDCLVNTANRYSGNTAEWMLAERRGEFLITLQVDVVDAHFAGLNTIHYLL
jgi:hypothetical protein